jgi:hypothetical protein
MDSCALLATQQDWLLVRVLGQYSSDGYPSESLVRTGYLLPPTLPFMN